MFRPVKDSRMVTTTTTAVSTNTLGDTIQDYAIVKLLGKGGFGHVYEAQSRLSGQKVAVKMIDKKLMRTSNMTKRVINEVEIHCQLKHPSILELYNYFEDIDYVYLVMELCSIGELSTYIKKKHDGRLTETEAAKFMKQIVEGLLYLHSHGIIHRDLKLSNMLLSDSLTIKIGDFGLAVKLESLDGEQQTMCGTPNYISPEIIARRPYGLQVDIWSVGCILYTFVVGKPPFDSRDPKKGLSKAYDGPYELPDYLSREVMDLIGKLLQKDPKDRLSLEKIIEHPFFLKKNSENKENSMLLKHSSIPSNLIPHSDPYFISNVGLKPCRHKTRHGVLEITKDGCVFMDLIKENHIYYITNQGEKIHCYERGVGEDSSRSIAQSRPERSYTSDKLSPKIKRHFEFAKKFVNLIRAKTPKVIYYSQVAKCMLMDNLPYGDLDMQFDDGTLLKNSIDKRELTIRLPDGEIHTIHTGSEKKLNIKSHLLPIFRHLQESLKICLDLEKSAQSSLLKGRKIKFPIVIRHPQTIATTTVYTNSQHVFPSCNGQAPSLLSTLSSIHPSSQTQPPLARQLHKVHDLSIIHSGLMSSTDLIKEASNSQRQESKLSKAVSEEQRVVDESSRLIKKKPIAAISSCSQTSPSQPMTMMMSTTSSSFYSINTLVTLDIRKTCFLNGIGWCLQASNEDLLVLFVDGIEFIVDSQNRSLHFIHNGDIRRYHIDSFLPETLKTKLIYLPEFMKLLGIAS